MSGRFFILILAVTTGTSLAVDGGGSCNKRDDLQQKLNSFVLDAFSRKVESVFDWGDFFRMTDRDDNYSPFKDCDIVTNALGDVKIGKALLHVSCGYSKSHQDKMFLLRTSATAKPENVTGQILSRYDDIVQGIFRPPTDSKFNTNLVIVTARRILDTSPPPFQSTPPPSDYYDYIYAGYNQNDLKEMQYRWAMTKTTDGGATFQTVEIPFEVMDSFSLYEYYYTRQPTVVAHPTSASRMIINGYLTENFGATFKNLCHELVAHGDCAFSKAAWVDPETLLVMLHSREGSVIVRYNNGRSSVVMHRVKGFLVKYGVVVCSVYHDTDRRERSIFVSRDGAKSFDRVQRASLDHHDRAFIYLMNPNLSFMAVQIQDKRAHGTYCYDLFVSDSNHLLYSLSMECVQHSMYSPHVVIEQLKALNGTFLVNVRDSADESRITSMISFNRGGHWSKMSIDGKPCDDCYSPIDDMPDVVGSGGDHNDTGLEAMHHTFTHLDSPQVPGFVISYMFRKSSQDSNHLPFLTTDGGHHWYPVPITDARYFELRSKGSVIVAFKSGVEDEPFAVSFDRGFCWYDLNLPLGSHDNNTSRYFYNIHQVPAESPFLEIMKVQDSGIQFDSEFFNGPAFSRDLKMSSIVLDLERFVRDNLNVCGADELQVREKVCDLGVSLKLISPNLGATCRLPEAASPVQEEKCECTWEDYECDLGFLPDQTAEDTLQCSPMPPDQFKQLSVCVYDKYIHKQHLLSTNGYRKIGGDSCIGETEYDNKEHSMNISLLCRGESDHVSAMQVQPSPPGDESSSSLLLLSLFTLATLAVLLTLTALLLHRKGLLRRPTWLHLPTGDKSFSFATLQNEP